MRVYLVRHGKTDRGATRQFQSPDTPLSPFGMHQVQALLPHLRDVSLDAIYTSPYKRAEMTAEILSAACNGCAPEVHPVFVEKNNSSRILGRSYFSLSGMQLGFATLMNIIQPSYRWADEETIYELAERARQARLFLELQSTHHAAVLVASHALFMAALIVEIQSRNKCNYLSSSTSFFKRLYRGIRVICLGLSMKNCALYTFEYNDSEKSWRKI